MEEAEQQVLPTIPTEPSLYGEAGEKGWFCLAENLCLEAVRIHILPFGSSLDPRSHLLYPQVPQLPRSWEGEMMSTWSSRTCWVLTAVKPTFPASPGQDADFLLLVRFTWARWQDWADSPNTFWMTWQILKTSASDRIASSFMCRNCSSLKTGKDGFLYSASLPLYLLLWPAVGQMLKLLYLSHIF